MSCRGEASAKIEAMLHKRLSDHTWRAFVKPAKKLREGEKPKIVAGKPFAARGNREPTDDQDCHDRPAALN